MVLALAVLVFGFVAVWDFLTRTIPDWCSVILIILWLIKAISLPGYWWADVLLGLAVFGVMLLLALKGGVGGGDVKFLGASALFMGYDNVSFLILVGLFSIPLWFLTLSQMRIRAYMKNRTFHWKWRIKRMRLPYGTAIATGAIYQLLSTTSFSF